MFLGAVGMKSLLLWFVILNLVLGFCNSHNHVDITLVGSYGDLAKKYLWRAFFKLYVKNLMKNDWTYKFYGAGTKTVTIGAENLLNALEKGIKCTGLDNFDCPDVLKNFVKKVRYLQLKNEEDYAKHCLSLFSSSMQNHCHKDHSCEYQSLFYLSVPPFAYKNISNFIASHCRPADGSGSLKVVFEKPFGHSKMSAIDLANDIEKYLHSNEVYRLVRAVLYKRT